MLHNVKDLPSTSDRWPRSKKKKTERVIRDNFFEGFMDEIAGAWKVGLEYASTSGLYSYNGVRRMAYEKGREFGKEVLEHKDSDKRIKISVDYKIPATVYAEGYAEMRLT